MASGWPQPYRAARPDRLRPAQAVTGEGSASSPPSASASRSATTCRPSPARKPPPASPTTSHSPDAATASSPARPSPSSTTPPAEPPSSKSSPDDRRPLLAQTRRHPGHGHTDARHASHPSAAGRFASCPRERIRPSSPPSRRRRWRRSAWSASDATQVLQRPPTHADNGIDHGAALPADGKQPVQEQLGTASSEIDIAQADQAAGLPPPGSAAVRHRGPVGRAGVLSPRQ